MSQNFPLLNEIKDELTQKLTGRVLDFYGAINSIHQEESYFISDTGVILRVLRGPTAGDEYAAILEFYDTDGSLLNKRQKGFEPTPLFSINYPREVVNSQFHLMKERPNFIPKPNNSYRSEVEPYPSRGSLYAKDSVLVY